ncbi:MAG: lipopolysaccharide transport periplasmic protein LptA [Rickettsiales bacterium]|jgi:lipopolysaccharide export system protein LptA|nr:lipopolysaccharide transport periplasmic protein LptA [Rickettsiales bacterium]
MFGIFFVIFLSIATQVLGGGENKPIRLESDEIKIRKNENLMVFTGKVKAEQAELNIFSDRMVVKYRNIGDGKIDINSIRARGNVVLKNKTIVARSDEALYDFKKQIITLDGNVILNEKDAVVFGDKLFYNIATDETSIEGSKTKKKNGNGEDTSNKRVTIILDNIKDIKGRYDGE